MKHICISLALTLMFAPGRQTDLGNHDRHREKICLTHQHECEHPYHPLPSSPKRVSPQQFSPDILIDSCCGYSLWTQIQESIAHSLIADGIQIVYRNYDHTGLNVTQLPGDLSYMIQDYNVAGARYSTSVAGTKPYISYPRVLPDRGEMVAQYCSGGWFSSEWDGPVDLGPGDLDIYRNIGKQLLDGNILFIGLTTTDMIVYRTWDSTLTNQIGSGVIASGVYYWGHDINGGIAYVFYYDDALNIYYQTTTDGVTWSGQQSYNMVWPDPYIDNIICWSQMAVTDAGDPILVFDVLDDADPTYPYYGTVYVSNAEGQPCTAVSAPDSECFYPTIATGGNMAAVLYCMPRNNLGDSLNWWDFYIVWSLNNGITWGTPQNITSELIVNPGLQQLAKRIDTIRARAYYVYCVNMESDVMDPYWNIGEASGISCASHLYLGETQYVGIEENPRSTKTETRLSVYPNPFEKLISIMYDAPHEGEVELNIYDATGRLIKCLDSQSPVFWDGSNNVGSHVPAGVYFLEIKDKRHTALQKVIKVD
jgi:hypothetical protein